jgi:hypothetical protein
VHAKRATAAVIDRSESLIVPPLPRFVAGIVVRPAVDAGVQPLRPVHLLPASVDT